MDARNSEHENLELAAIFCQADISILFSEKTWVFFLHYVLKYSDEISVIVEVWFYSDLFESQNYSTRYSNIGWENLSHKSTC